MGFEKGNKLARGGARPGAGRKSKSVEQEYLAAFESVVSVERFKEMTKTLLKLFDDDQLIYDKDGRPFDVKVSPETRARIWEKLAAYAMGTPVQRVEQGRIGDLAKYLEDLRKRGEMGESESDRKDIRASWVQPAPPK